MNTEQMRQYVRNKLNIGSMVKVYRNDLREGKNYENRMVVGFYPHHILTVDSKGFYESIIYFDALKCVE